MLPMLCAAAVLSLSSFQLPARPTRAVRASTPSLALNLTAPADGGFLQPVRQASSKFRSLSANALAVTPPWISLSFGTCIFVASNAVFKSATLMATPAPELDAALARLLCVGFFAAVSDVVLDVPASEWLWPLRRARAAEVSPNPLFMSGSPLAGVTFAFILMVPLAVAAQVLGLAWLPPPREFPSAELAALRLVVAPATEVTFFSAWLTTAFRRAGGDELSAVVAAGVLFGLFKVPLSDALAPDGSTALLFYEILGAYLAFLYQRSGGSLPFVAIVASTTATTTAALSAAQIGSALPFGIG